MGLSISGRLLGQLNWPPFPYARHPLPLSLTSFLLYSSLLGFVAPPYIFASAGTWRLLLDCLNDTSGEHDS